MAAQPDDLPVVETVDTRYLESLMGYNARRAALRVIERFPEHMAPYGLRPVDFSILSLITHNPGITARQLGTTLKIQPPNLVSKIGGFDKRGLIERRPHPLDGRAVGLHLTPQGSQLMKRAERTATDLEAEVIRHLTDTEKKTLLRLLQKIYLGAAG
jgi:DNA-binding MarR family transcriptional regulator